MATQRTVAQVIPFPSHETKIKESPELLEGVCQRFSRQNPTRIEQQRIPEIKEALLCSLQCLIWKYGCVHCNAKKLTHTGAGLLCAQCFGRTRRDIKKIVAYLAAAEWGVS